MDAFFVAFKIPNIFRRFFAEGAFSQAFVPVFTEYDETRSQADVKELVDRVTGTLGLVLLVMTVVGVVAAPALISVFGMGWVWSSVPEDADKFELAVDMLRLTFPYLFFVSLVALGGGILNTYQRFAAPAFAPVLLNVVLISFAALIAPYYSRPGIALAAGVFVAGFVQLLFLLPFLGRLKVLPRPRWGSAHPGVRKIGKLMVPAIFGSSVAQINILFDTLIASFLVTGSISWLYYSDRLMEFPLGVFGIALATVILPNLSRHHAAESPQAFSSTLDWAMRLAVLIALPATIGLFMLAGPVLTTIFYGGQFDIDDVAMAVPSLMAYSVGLTDAHAGADRHHCTRRQHVPEYPDRRAVGACRLGGAARRSRDRDVRFGVSQCRPPLVPAAQRRRLAPAPRLAPFFAAGRRGLRRHGHHARPVRGAARRLGRSGYLDPLPVAGAGRGLRRRCLCRDAVCCRAPPVRAAYDIVRYVRIIPRLHHR